jgi:hypothetical protein
MKKYNLSIPDALSDRITEAHKHGKFSALFPSQFIKHLITMGLEEYWTQEKCRAAQPETRRQAAGCETALGMILELAQHTERIIPFPGVELNREVNYQNALDGFLREMGYVE